MKHLLPILAVACVCASSSFAVEFEPPVRITADGKPIQVESPGYAAPAFADIDNDGKMDLLVGQFSNGKIHVFRNLGGGKFGPDKPLEVAGKVAQVPGVW